ncbi:hypothetical protein HK098_005057 [Nowakowskiella sp. JEL0407]|nr:hypothetical protein HK098_005057 [Nowakowskiella sp. JEL0407]
MANERPAEILSKAGNYLDESATASLSSSCRALRRIFIANLASVRIDLRSKGHSKFIKGVVREEDDGNFAAAVKLTSRILDELAQILHTEYVVERIYEHSVPSLRDFLKNPPSRKVGLELVVRDTNQIKHFIGEIAKGLQDFRYVEDLNVWFHFELPSSSFGIIIGSLLPNSKRILHLKSLKIWWSHAIEFDDNFFVGLQQLACVAVKQL